MSLFAKSKSNNWVGIYTVLDPVLDKDLPRFSPPFFSTADDVACQALLETLRRHSLSFEELYSSPFLRMELWRIGSVDLNKGVVVEHKHRYKVVTMSEYLERPHIKHYMQSLPYGCDTDSESEATHN